MSRSIWKGPYVHPSTKDRVLQAWTLNQLLSEDSDSQELKQIQKDIQSKEMSRSEILKTYGVEIKDRRSTILPDFVEKIVKIHKGNAYVPVEIKKEHVGLKFGSLVRTKRIPEYKKKK